MQSSCHVNRINTSLHTECDGCGTVTTELFILSFHVRNVSLCLPCYCALKEGMREMIGRPYNPIPDPGPVRVAPCNTPAEGRDVAKPRTQQIGSVDRALDEEYEQWLREHPEEV